MIYIVLRFRYSVSSDRLSEGNVDHGTPSRLSVGAGSCGWNTPTPTWTEGTPSYTESSYSGDLGGASGADNHSQRTGASLGPPELPHVGEAAGRQPADHAVHVVVARVAEDVCFYLVSVYFEFCFSKMTIFSSPSHAILWSAYLIPKLEETSHAIIVQQGIKKNN